MGSSGRRERHTGRIRRPPRPSYRKKASRLSAFPRSGRETLGSRPEGSRCQPEHSRATGLCGYQRPRTLCPIGFRGDSVDMSHPGRRDFLSAARRRENFSLWCTVSLAPSRITGGSASCNVQWRAARPRPLQTAVCICGRQMPSPTIHYDVRRFPT